MKRVIAALSALWMLGVVAMAPASAQAPEKRKITIAVGGKNLF